MKSEDGVLLRDLLTRQRVLGLSVLIDGKPNVSQVPFAIRADLCSALILVSALARHSRGLVDGAGFSALVRGEDDGVVDPFRIPRATLRGIVRPIVQNEPEYGAARDEYLARLPSAKALFGLGDFTLHELVIERIRFVAGFAAAHTVEREQLRELGAS